MASNLRVGSSNLSGRANRFKGLRSLIVWLPGVLCRMCAVRLSHDPQGALAIRVGLQVWYWLVSFRAERIPRTPLIEVAALQVSVVLQVDGTEARFCALVRSSMT